MNFPVFDLHCDTAFALLGEDFSRKDSLRHNQYHVDLDRASKFTGYAQCFACYTCPSDMLPTAIAPESLFRLEYEHILSEIDRNQDKIRLAKSVADIDENRRSGYMSAILSIEGTAGFGYDGAQLESLREMGFLLTTLGWNERNCLAGSHATGGGLTGQGRDYVKRAQALGMLIDVSHISDEAFWDIMDITGKPVIASHSNSRSVHNVSRNLTDEMFRAICATDGLVGINLYTEFLGASADLDTVCDHIFHFMELDPSATHIALGGDLDGCDSLPEGFSGIQSYPALARRLIHRGLSEDTVYQIFWKNALGVFERCCT